MRRQQAEARQCKTIWAPRRRLPTSDFADLLEGVTPEAMREAFDWGRTRAAKSSSEVMLYLPEAGDLAHIPNAGQDAAPLSGDMR